MESKSKILYLYKLLNELTDELHPISTAQIIAEMKNRNVDIARKAVAANIQLLEEIGVDIVTIRSSQNLYYLRTRHFDFAEVKVLIDAVESSKLITKVKSKELVVKLSNLVSKHQATELDREIYIDKNMKPGTEEFYSNIDKIHLAIHSQKQIEFKYIEFNGEKEVVFKHDGKVYEVSPYTIALKDDFYYVIGFSNSHNEIKTFRIDRMTRAELTKKEAITMPAYFNIPDYVKNNFYEHANDFQTIELKCTNELMKVIIDKFGDDVKTQTLGSNCFKAYVSVSTSPTFYGWVFQFAGQMSIIAPPSIKKEYIAMANLVLNS